MIAPALNVWRRYKGNEFGEGDVADLWLVPQMQPAEPFRLADAQWQVGINGWEGFTDANGNPVEGVWRITHWMQVEGPK